MRLSFKATLCCNRLSSTSSLATRLVGHGNILSVDERRQPAMAAEKKGILPSVSDLLGQSKRQKTALTSVRHACSILRSEDNLNGLDQNELDVDDKAILAVARHGLTTVVKSIKLMQSIPAALGRQRKALIAAECNISTDEIDSLTELLEDHSEYFCDSDVSIVLVPPVVQCFDCEKGLVTNHVTKVKCYSCTGASFGTKITLRCKHCSISYNYSQFGNKRENGFRYYPMRQEYVEASDTVFIHRQLLEVQCCLA